MKQASNKYSSHYFRLTSVLCLVCVLLLCLFLKFSCCDWYTDGYWCLSEKASFSYRNNRSNNQLTACCCIRKVTWRQLYVYTGPGAMQYSRKINPIHKSDNFSLHGVHDISITAPICIVLSDKWHCLQFWKDISHISGNLGVGLQKAVGHPYVGLRKLKCQLWA